MALIANQNKCRCLEQAGKLVKQKSAIKQSITNKRFQKIRNAKKKKKDFCFRKEEMNNFRYNFDQAKIRPYLKLSRFSDKNDFIQK